MRGLSKILVRRHFWERQSNLKERRLKTEETERPRTENFGERERETPSVLFRVVQKLFLPVSSLPFTSCLVPPSLPCFFLWKRLNEHRESERETEREKERERESERERRRERKRVRK